MNAITMESALGDNKEFKLLVLEDELYIEHLEKKLGLQQRVLTTRHMKHEIKDICEVSVTLMPAMNSACLSLSTVSLQLSLAHSIPIYS